MVNFSSQNYLLDLVKKLPEMLKEKKLVVFLADGLGLVNLKLPFLKKFVY